MYIYIRDCDDSEVFDSSQIFKIENSVVSVIIIGVLIAIIIGEITITIGKAYCFSEKNKDLINFLSSSYQNIYIIIFE